MPLLNKFTTQILQASRLVGRLGLAWPMRKCLSLPAFIFVTAACCPLLFCTSIAWSQQRIGTADTIRRDVNATRQPQTVALKEDYPVLQKDLIGTRADSAALLVFQDNTGIAIAPETRIELNEVVYNPENPAKSKFEASISAGAIRVQTGELPKYAYVINTSSPARIDPSSTVTITVSTRGATTVSVAEGSATVTAAGRTVTVAAGQSTLVLRGAPPTPPVPTPPPPPIVIEMDRLLQMASLQKFGTRAAARSPAVEAPSDAGTHTFSPNIDGKMQSEIAGGESRGTHVRAASRGTH
jgi:hypothetical protein